MLIMNELLFFVYIFFSLELPEQFSNNLDTLQSILVS